VHARRSITYAVVLALWAAGCSDPTTVRELTVNEQAMLGTYTLAKVGGLAVPRSVGLFLGNSGADVSVTGGTMALTANHFHLNVALLYVSVDPIQGRTQFTDSVVTDGAWNAAAGPFVILTYAGQVITAPVVSGTLMTLTVTSGAFGSGHTTQDLELHR
jgi:hypothetical protein